MHLLGWTEQDCTKLKQTCYKLWGLSQQNRLRQVPRSGGLRTIREQEIKTKVGPLFPPLCKPGKFPKLISFTHCTSRKLCLLYDVSSFCLPIFHKSKSPWVLTHGSEHMVSFCSSFFQHDSSLLFGEPNLSHCPLCSLCVWGLPYIWLQSWARPGPFNQNNKSFWSQWLFRGGHVTQVSQWEPCLRKSLFTPVTNLVESKCRVADWLSLPLHYLGRVCAE